ncbi:MAG TPA: hypothetical protein VHJ20_11595 [Polyangia bacterium]|nr:hypothetical protein [Polyangia bacterium]
MASRWARLCAVGGLVFAIGCHHGGGLRPADAGDGPADVAPQGEAPADAGAPETGPATGGETGGGGAGGGGASGGAKGETTDAGGADADVTPADAGATDADADGPRHLGAIAASPGTETSCVVLVDGTARCWGVGFLGDGPAVTTTTVAPERAHTVAGLSDAVAISSGRTHVCALRGNGDVVCWGANDHGQLGRASTCPPAGCETPTPVEGLGKAVDVRAAREYTCALLVGGTVACWGSNARGQLGAPNQSFVAAVPGVSNATAIAAGWFHTCAVVGGGSVACWGGALLGDEAPALVPSIDDATGVSVTNTMTCISRRDHSVWCWADDDHQSMGAWTPASVAHVDNAHAVAGTCAVLGAGDLACWSGTAAANIVPNLDGVTSLSAAVEQPVWLAVDRDGSVWTFDSKAQPTRLSGW